METITKLCTIAAIPVIASVTLHYLFKIPRHSRFPYWLKQILVGIFFGGIAVLATEYGVPLNGATMNARDAAPLCAAIIFGGPAGIIAGLIGGIERWFAVYWGAGAYTRLACSISTCLVGVLGAILKKFLFNNKIPRWPYALGIGIIGEVIHMLMVFVTHMDDIATAFSVVKICTAPMIIINASAVGLAVLIVGTHDKSNNLEKVGTQSSISLQIQKGLLALMVLAFAVTCQFTYVMQDSVSISDTYSLLNKNVQDIKNEIDQKSDKNMLEVTRSIKAQLEGVEITDEYLATLAEIYDVTDINIVDSVGYIIHSNNRDFIGYDMTSSSQSNAFMALTSGISEMVKPYQAIGYDSDLYRKYAGISMRSGFIQIGYDAERIQKDLDNEIEDAATYRHIGKSGGMLIADQFGFVLSSSNDRNNFEIKYVMRGYSPNQKENEIFEVTMDGEKYFAIIICPEGYTIAAFIPTDEVYLSRDISLYNGIFMLAVVFASLFILISILIDIFVVANFHKVNNALSKITSGELNTSLNVRSNSEFSSLSNGINETVNAMKGWIDEANMRIDKELSYAKDIQFASLPTMFPAFPERNEFDIYASMTPAKEVGGDFYDFYIIKGNTLAFLVADVSGKGIPAALFMMKAKSIIKTYAENDIAVADILTNANFNLCEGNEAGMFVTCFIAFLNLETGEMKYANAGHNHPLIKRKDGKYEYLKAPPGFILGGMEGILYKERSLMMEEGDEIFLYTDGVTEATNANKELYGDDRLEQMLNTIHDTDSETLCHLVKEDVDNFYKGCPQFDDITMLSVKFIKKSK